MAAILARRLPSSIMISQINLFILGQILGDEYVMTRIKVLKERERKRNDKYLPDNCP